MSVLISVLSTVVALVAAGCSDDDDDHDMGQMPNSMGQMSSRAGPSSSTTASAQFNQADVMFAEMMYPHHAQAVEMSDLVDGRTSNAALIELAGAITSAQIPEMEQMARWLEEWGKPAPRTEMGGMGGMDGMGGSMNGMMSQQEIDDLAAKKDAAFDQAWLTMMIEHHEGAIDMAEAVTENGLNPDVKAMAAAIITSQQAEIVTMRALLQR